MRVGVEVGGTFTDLVAIDGHRVVISKVPSTPEHPDLGAMNAIDEAGLAYPAIQDLVHGSTVATNAILERKGARVAFFVTAGFRDLLFLQRHDRTRIYDLFYRKPQPVVARADVFEIPERTGAEGQSLRPLDREATDAVVAAAVGSGHYEAAAICLLNAYANPSHEQAVAEIVRRRAPRLVVTCSSDVTREFREFERASTATLAAYVQPVIDGYLDRLERSLGARRFQGHFSLMQSNGGRLPAAGMRRNAITSLFSGPAAGVIGAVRQCARSGNTNLITLDMGGTSTDVCLVRGGQPSLAAETHINGLPVRTPVIDIETIGAGGGSVVWVDDGGLLRVGPESTGAAPGPACYGRGGSEPAITDAHLLRGTLRPEAFLGGRMEVDVAASRTAMAPLASRFEMSPEAIADAAIRIADANIVRAIQLVSTERGHDPRDFALVPFGGAGPLHAARVAEQLRIRTVLIPPNAGVLSAFGLLAADYQLYESRTRKIGVDHAAPATVREVFEEMRGGVLDSFHRLGLAGEINLSYSLEMRFVGQAFEIPVDFDEAALAVMDEATLLARFNAAHHQMYAFGDAGRQAVEIVSFRLGAKAPPDEIPLLSAADVEPRSSGPHAVYENGVRKDCRILSRAGLGPSHSAAGPALIEDDTSTIYVPEGWRAALDAEDNLILTHEESTDVPA